MKHRIVHFILPLSVEKRDADRIFGCNYGFFLQHNIFLLSAATVLKKAGFQVEVTNCPKDNISLEEALKIPTDIYVFYSVFLSRKTDLETARIIRKKNRKKPIIFLGPDPTYYPKKYLLFDNFFVVRGEPELTLLELVENINDDIASIGGVSWKKKSKIIDNPQRPIIEDLDILPIPDRMLYKNPFSYPNARFRNFPSTTILTSRGCSFRCYYCVPNSLSYARELEEKRFKGKKPPVRLHSPERIIREFEQIADLGFRSVSVLDDQFIWGKKRTLAICEGIRDLNLELSILARCDMIQDLELAQALAKAGVKHIAFGVESFNQKILDYVRKDLDVKTIEKAIKLTKRAGIEPEINVLLGSCPLETKETIEDTLRRVENLDVEIIHVNVCTPFPGTDFEKEAKKHGWTTVPEYVPIDPASESLISYPYLTDKDLEKAVRRFYRRHYFSLPYFLKSMKSLRSPYEFWAKLRTAKNIVRNVFSRKERKK